MSPEQEEAEFDRWLRETDADMRQTVESAIDVEAELARFKQRVADGPREATP
jgi:hypothetical protein